MVATGDDHRREACVAAQQMRPILNGRPLVLVTDETTADVLEAFDTVTLHPEPQGSYRDKIGPMLQLPFTRTLFLDTDVALLNPIDDVFTLLRHVDLVGCHAPVRWCQWKDKTVPEGMVEINTGVLGFKRSRRTHNLIKDWLATYDKVGVPFDQAAFRSALWRSCRSGLRILTLPPEYNLRTTKPWIAGKGLAVKILHGRIPDEMRPRLAAYLNTNIDGFRASSAFPTGQNAKVLEPDPQPVGNTPSWQSLPADQVCGRRLFVMGAGRSGTSLLAGLFRGSGLFMGDMAYQARDANPLGFFEDREVNAINEALLAPLIPLRTAGASEGMDRPGEGQRWLARLPLSTKPIATPELRHRIQALYSRGPSCFKDPRFCHTLEVWRDLVPQDEQQQMLFLCVFRHPSVVLASVLKEMHSAPYLRNLAISVDQVLECWVSHYTHVLNRHAQSGRWLFLAYEQLLEPQALDRIEAFTGHIVDRDLPQASLNRSHHLSMELPPSVMNIYQQLCDRSLDMGEP